MNHGEDPSLPSSVSSVLSVVSSPAPTSYVHCSYRPRRAWLLGSTAMHPDLPRLLQDIHEAEGDFEYLLYGALERGIPLGELVGRVEFSDYTDFDAYTKNGPLLTLEDEGEGWLDSLCTVAGGPAAAQAILEQGFGWMAEVDVAAVLAGWAARGQLDRCANDPSNPGALLEAVNLARAGLASRQVDWKLSEVVENWPIEALIQLDWLPLDLLREQLPHRASWPQLLDEAEAAVGPDRGVTWIARILDHPIDEGEAPDIRYLELAWELRRNTGLSAWEHVRRVSTRLAPAMWISVARRLGFPSSQCVLVLLDDGTSIADTAALMSRGGWRDSDLLEGLRENGIGPSPALVALQRSGWSAPRMAASLRAGGLLEAEVREALRALGLPLERIDTLLSSSKGVLGPGSSGR